MTIPIGAAPVLRARIYSPDRPDVEDIGDLFTDFEWVSFINGGYSIRVRVIDTLYKRLHKLATTFYLDKSRSIPIPITFQLIWGNVDSDEYATPEFTAYITKIHAHGIPNTGYIEFTAVDPPSFVLSHVSSGLAYTGNVSSVIRNVIKNANDAVFAEAPIDPATNEKPKIAYEVSDTNDDKNGIWYQMRQSSALFIKSLLEWSSSITNDKSQWIVSSGQKRSNKNKDISYPAIFIKQWAELKDNLNSDQALIGTLSFNSASPGANDIIDFQFIGDNFIGVTQSRLTTGGISTTSGLYIDPQYEEKNIKKAQVDDARTPKKLNVDVDKSKSYTKPSENQLDIRSSNIIAIPELNGGEMGIKYQDYIDGRARNQYHKTVGSLMRIRLTVNGWYKIWDSTTLGASVVSISWKDNDEQDYFLSGDWILYGFKHRMSRENWVTDLYLSRIDHDAEAEIVPDPRKTRSN